MSTIKLVKTIKIKLITTPEEAAAFDTMTGHYKDACNYVSQYIFDSNDIPLSLKVLNHNLYYGIRADYSLNSQMAQSTIKTVIGNYKAVKQQLKNTPFKYQADDGSWKYVPRTLEWLTSPVTYKKSQADLVHAKDYSFTKDFELLSINANGKRIKIPFICKHGEKQLKDSKNYKKGTATLVKLDGTYYLHIPVTYKGPDEPTAYKNVVGIDRGLRFLAAVYDSDGKSSFISGKEVAEKQKHFTKLRAELQSKGTKSTKRVLKRLARRENSYYTYVNHCISKALVERYGKDTLFVLEDLTGVSFNNGTKSKEANHELHSWAFYQLEQFLTYKAQEVGAKVITVDPHYTSQRCPICGRIHKGNRDHKTHEYRCDVCRYRSNDDRVAAMNIYQLGQRFVTGEKSPSYK